MQLNDIPAIVTGGASGLGAATVRLLARGGAKVAIFDSAEAGAALAEEVGGCFSQVDVASEASVVAGFAAARKIHGPERILINCAGVGSLLPVPETDDEDVLARAVADFERTLQINLVGTYRCMVRSIAGMRTLAPLTSGERGVIVNTSSIAAEDGGPGQTAYAASKAAIVGLALPLARELGSSGIRVNTILPGVFDTAMLGAIPDDHKAALAGAIPFPQRMGMADEFAELAVAMVRNVSVNAARYRIDGALRM